MDEVNLVGLAVRKGGGQRNALGDALLVERFSERAARRVRAVVTAFCDETGGVVA
jgi:hypothetical protein